MMSAQIVKTSGIAKMTRAADVYVQQEKLNIVVLQSFQATEKYNQLTDEGKRVAALIHLTC